MIQGLLFRWGLGALAPFALPLLFSLVVGGGGLSAWLAGWSDWKTTVLLMVAISMVAALSLVEGKLPKILIGLVLAATLYAKGRIDSDLEHEPAMATLRAEHKIEKDEIHRGYRVIAEKERERQEEANRQLAARTEGEKQAWDIERIVLRSERDKAITEAANAKNAQRVAFDIDAIDRINRLRYNPATKRHPGGLPARSRKTKAGKGAVLDDKALPASYRPAEKRTLAGGKRSVRGKGRQEVRGLPEEAWGLSQVAGGPGLGFDWWTSWGNWGTWRWESFSFEGKGN